MDGVLIGAHRIARLVDRCTARGEARPLSTGEIGYLRSLFGSAIDYEAVRVLYFGIKRSLRLRAHVVCNDVWLSDDCIDEVGDLSPHGWRVLLHEAVHVWQFQRTGSGYLSRALGAQLVHGSHGVGSGQAYDWLHAAEQGNRFADMNPESQAELGCWIGQSLTEDGELDRMRLQELARLECQARPHVLTKKVLAIVCEARDILRG